MSLIDKAVAHGASQKLRPIEVPEWGATIWVGMYTVKEAVMIHGRFGGEGNLVPATVMVRAKTETGEPAFDVGAKELDRLKTEVDATVLLRIEKAMSDALMSDEGGAEKK